MKKFFHNNNNNNIYLKSNIENSSIDYTMCICVNHVYILYIISNFRYVYINFHFSVEKSKTKTYILLNLKVAV